MVDFVTSEVYTLTDLNKPRFIDETCLAAYSNEAGEVVRKDFIKRYGILKGVASTTQYQRNNRIIIDPFAFKESVDNKPLKGVNGIRLQLEHKTNPIWDLSGHIRELRYSDDGKVLNIEVGVLVGATDTSSGLIVEDKKNMAAYLAAVSGDAGFSVGFEALDYTKHDDYVQIHKGNLLEVSLTRFPSDVYAYACSTKETETTIGRNKMVETAASREDLEGLKEQISVTTAKIEEVLTIFKSVTESLALLNTRILQREATSNSSAAGSIEIGDASVASISTAIADAVKKVVLEDRTDAPAPTAAASQVETPLQTVNAKVQATAAMVATPARAVSKVASEILNSIKEDEV